MTSNGGSRLHGMDVRCEKCGAVLGTQHMDGCGKHPSWSDAAQGRDPLGIMSQKVYAHFAETYADTQGDVAAMRAMSREIVRLELALRCERSQGWDPNEPYLPLARAREFG